MNEFQRSVNGKCFFPVQGNHDGFCDLTLTDVYSADMAIDEDWYEATSFVDLYENVIREKNKPYFCVDYPQDKVRIIVMCTCYYNGYYNGEVHEKKFGVDAEQIDWLKNTAVDVGEGWTVMIFSHDKPFVNFNEDTCADNSKINGNLAVDIIKKARQKNKFDFAGWFVGHTHGDFIGKVNGLNFILVASETAYVPQLWDMQEGYFPERQLGTATEDLWDSVVLDQKSRKIRIFRFGAGNDREIGY